MNHISYQTERFLVRQKMKQKIVELAKKYNVSDIKPLSRVYGQQQLLLYSDTESRMNNFR